MIDGVRNMRSTVAPSESVVVLPTCPRLIEASSVVPATSRPPPMIVPREARMAQVHGSVLTASSRERH